MYVVVSYDITDDRRRQRVGQVLENFGDRVQLSVFECSLNGHEILQMADQLRSEIQPSTDSVRIYSLCSACARRLVILGQGRPLDTPDVYIV